MQAPAGEGQRRPADALQRERLGMVAWLAKSESLQVRVCVLRFGEGIGQAKFGIVGDGAETVRSHRRS